MPDITSAIDTVSIAENVSAEIAPREIAPDRFAELLLHVDGADGSQDIIDSSVNNIPITVVSAPEIDTAEKKFGPSSIDMKGLSTAGTNFIRFPAGSIDFRGKDFTIECFLRPRNWPATNHRYALFSEGDGDGVSNSTINWWLHRTVADELRFFFRVIDPSGSLVVQIIKTWGDIGTGDRTLDTFHHFAVTRQGTTWRLFANGALLGSLVDSTDFHPPIKLINIGKDAIFDLYTIDGHIDEYRIVVGQAVYTAAFTPPTAPFTGGHLGEDVATVENVSLSVIVPDAVDVSDPVVVAEAPTLVIPVLFVDVSEALTIVEFINVFDSIVELFASDIIGTDEDLVPDMPINFEVAEQKGIAIITVSGF